MKILVVAIVMIAAGMASRSWRRGLEAVLILVVLEGAIRKWIAPAAASYVYFAKDVVLLAVYWGFSRDRRATGVPGVRSHGLLVAILLAAGVAVLQVFNPKSPSVLVGILGVKAYLFYIPLVWLVPALFRDEIETARWIRRHILLAIPVGLLAIGQFLSPADSRLNTYARSGTGAVTEDSPTAITFGSVSRVRVTGTFSFITGFSSYLQVVSFLALSALMVRRWRFRGSLIIYLAFILMLLGMLMSGSRGPVFLMIVILPIYWVLGVAREGGVPALGRFLLGLGLVLSVVNVVGADAVSAFRSRAGGSDDVLSRIVQPFLNPFRILPEVGLVGYGTGTTHQMAEVVAPSLLPYSWLEGLHFEDEPSRVMVELGPMGFFPLFFARASLVVLALGAIFRLQRPLPRALALSCLLHFLAQLTGGVVFNVTGGVYYWFFAGLLFLAIRLDREALALERSEAPAAVAPRRFVAVGAVGR